MAGVLVSNGEQVVPSSADGSYVLAAESGGHSFAWVVVPDGFSTSGPFYLPARAAGEKADFELVPAPPRSAGEFKVVQASDFHLGRKGGSGKDRDDLVEDLLQIAAIDAPDLIVVSGDLTDSGSLKRLLLCRSAFTALDIPVLPFFGGHDGKEERLESEPGATCTRHYEEVFGPPYYSFDRGGRHWVLYPNEEGYFSPQDRERKAAWLRRDLEMQPQHREIVVFVHATPSLSFIEELSRFRVRMVLHGHRHANKAFLHRGMEVVSTPPLCFGGADTSARGYRVLDCGPGRINSRFRALHRPLSAATVGAAPALGQRALRKVWEYRLPGELHRAAPACRGRFIVVSSGDGSPGRGSGIHGLEAATGRMRWRQGTESAIKNRVSTDEAGNCAAVSVAGRIYLMDVHSGAGQWTVDLPGYPERWVYSSPAISGAAVFAGSNAGYGAYDLETGEPLWYTSFVGDASRVIDKPSYSSPLVAGELLVIALPKRGILGLHRSSGRVVWERQAGVSPFCCSPALADDLIICGGEADRLIALKAKSGEPVWSAAMPRGDYPTGLALAGNKIYVATSAGAVQCRDRCGGMVEWNYGSGEDLVDMVPRRRGGRSVLASPLVWGQWVVACGNDGVVSLLDASSGKCLSRTALGAPVSAAPCAVGDGLGIGTWDGRLLHLAR